MTPDQREKLRTAAVAAENIIDDGRALNYFQWLVTPSTILSLIAQVEALTVPLSEADVEEVSQSIADRVNELAPNAELRAAATAVVARWDSPKWKDEAPTADFIARLRRALAAPTIPAIPGTKEGA